MADAARSVAVAALAVLLCGCAVYGGAGSARLDGSTLTTSSASASVGTGGVRTQSSTTVRRYE